MKKIRVLHVIGHIGKGGDTTAVFSVMNYIKDVGENVTFDFLTHSGCDMEVVKQLRENGSKVYILDGDVREIGVLKYYKEIKKVLIENQYDCIHFHTSFQSCVGLIAAKRIGIKSRICHSHTSSIQRECGKIAKFALPVCKMIIRIMATDLVACSNEAAVNLFYRNSNYRVIYNGLKIQELIQYDDEKFEKFKQSINYDKDKIYIGQVGRMTKMKNPIFTIDLSKNLDRDKYEFIFLGSGDLFEKLKTENQSEKNIKFMGRVDNVNDYMRIFDYLVLPSIYGEGLPVVLVEQQIVNHNCICIANENISKEANLGNVKYININDLDEWIKCIKSDKKKEKNINTDMFDINNTAKDWLNLYKNNVE